MTSRATTSTEISAAASSFTRQRRFLHSPRGALLLWSTTDTPTTVQPRHPRRRLHRLHLQMTIAIDMPDSCPPAVPPSAARQGTCCLLGCRQAAGPSTTVFRFVNFLSRPRFASGPFPPSRIMIEYEFWLLRRDDLPVSSGADPFRPQENAGDRPPGRALPQRVPARFQRIPLADRVRNEFPGWR